MSERRRSLMYELMRKSLHLSGVGIVFGYTLLVNWFSERVAILVLTGVLLIMLEIEYIRLEHRPSIFQRIHGALRPHEADQVTGAVFFMVSCIICFAAFDYWIAVLAMFMTIFGDLCAALVGKTFGETVILNGKTYVGTLAGLAANVVVGVLILPGFLYLVVPIAITATVVELLTNRLDDNLTVPLFSGFVGQMLVYYYSAPLPPIDFTFLGLF